MVEIGDVVEGCCRGEGGGGGAVMRTLVSCLPKIEMTAESRACAWFVQRQNVTSLWVGRGAWWVGGEEKISECIEWNIKLWTIDYISLLYNYCSPSLLVLPHQLLRDFAVFCRRELLAEEAPIL